MKKGFTLVEIMAVITVLALITIAIVPSIIKQVTDKKDEVNATTLSLIYDAASLYTANDKATYKNEMGNVYCITLETLVKEGLLDKTVTNFKTGKAIPLNTFIKMNVNIYREFEYSLLEQDEKCIESSGTLLSEVAEVGDYVSYDAGIWSETKEKPTSQGQFGGYTKGQNKGISVTCNEGSTSLKGWRILSINSNTITIVHAGNPECYYAATTSVAGLNNRAVSEYLNEDYATSAHMMNYNEAYAITGSIDSTTNDLRYTRASYWLSSPGETYGLYGISGNEGDLWNYSDINRSLGIRPVVVLKDNIKTSGKGVDIFNQEAWQLIKP